MIEVVIAPTFVATAPPSSVKASNTVAATTAPATAYSTVVKPSSLVMNFFILVVISFISFPLFTSVKIH